MGFVEPEAADHPGGRHRNTLKGAAHLVATDVLLAGDLGVRAAARRPGGQSLPKALGHPLAARQPRVLLGVSSPAPPAAPAPLSPHKPGHTPGQGQIAHPDHRALLDLGLLPPAVRAGPGRHDALDLEVERVVIPDDHVHDL